MELNLLVVGLIFLSIGYLIGVKKLTWLLAGYNEKRVADKNKLARLVGLTFALLGIGVIVCSFFEVLNPEIILTSAVAIILLEVIYVNVKLVN